MNTLKTIQTLAKIGKVFSKIIFVCCIVGFCGCIVGIVSLALGAETFKLGGVTIHSMIENEAGLNLPTLYASMAVGLRFCAAEAVSSMNWPMVIPSPCAAQRSCCAWAS